AGGELAGQVISGSARFLREPDRLAPPAYLAESPWPAEEEAPTPVPAPGGPPPVPGPGAIPMTPIPGVGDAGTAAPAEVVLPPVLVGLELAGSLGLEVGGQVELIAPDGEAGPAGLQPKSRSFRVAGLITTGLYDYDMKLVYTTLGEAQRFLGLEDSVNRVEARLEDLEDAGAVAATAAGWLDPERCTVDDWKRMNRNLFSALELEWVVMFLVLGFVVLIASFSILSSLLMIIRQRTGAISILRCMGFRLRDLGRVFLVLGALVGLLGSLSGLLLGLSSCVLLGDLGLPLPGEYYIRVLPVDLEPGAVAIIVVASWLLTVVASIYPARRASRTNLLEGLYDER
ncbi:MAG: ABC transporter permease, partial [Deltaproteobacteria bacterium]|nr:ABC transporter permease [Deltaproteobacteria bacterium]